MKKSFAVLAVLPVFAFSVSMAAPSPHTQATQAVLHPADVNLTPLGANIQHVNTTSTITPSAVPTSYIITGLPAIADIGQTGSSVAYATTYYQKTYGTGGTLSYNDTNTFSPDYVTNHLGSNIIPMDAYNFLTSSGACYISDMTKTPSQQAQIAALHKNISSTNIFSGAGKGTATTRTTVKNELYFSHTLVGITVPIYPEWDNAQATDSYVVDRPLAGEVSRGATFVTIVGYDDNKAYNGYIGAFKIVNQWGTAWGNAGYTWISYDFFQNNVTEAWYGTYAP